MMLCWYTLTHTHMKPTPTLMGMGTIRHGYGYLWVKWVWNPCGLTPWVATWYKQIIKKADAKCAFKHNVVKSGIILVYAHILGHELFIRLTNLLILGYPTCLSYCLWHIYHTTCPLCTMPPVCPHCMSHRSSLMLSMSRRVSRRVSRRASRRVSRHVSRRVPCRVPRCVSRRVSHRGLHSIALCRHVVFLIPLCHVSNE